MNMRFASKRDRQKEAWTKVPPDVAAAITAWANEQKLTEYETVRRLIYSGMLSATAASEWHEKKHGVPLMSDKVYRAFLKLCEREMRWYVHGIKPTGKAAKALAEA